MDALRKNRIITQNELAKLLYTSNYLVGRSKRVEITSSIEVAKSISVYLNTTLGYLIGETDKTDQLKDPVMLQKLAELNKMESKEKSHILQILDGLIKSVKLKNTIGL